MGASPPRARDGGGSAARLHRGRRRLTSIRAGHAGRAGRLGRADGRRRRRPRPPVAGLGGAPGREPAGQADHLVFDDGYRGPRPAPAAAGRRRLERLYPARPDRGRRARRSGPPSGWRRSSSTSRARSVAVVATRRGDPGRDRLSGRGSRRSASIRSRRSSRRATGSALPLAGRDEDDGVRRRSRSRPASGSARPRRTGSSSSATTAGCRRRAWGRASPPRPSRPRSPSTASTTCCSRPASDASSRFGPREAFLAWWRAAHPGRPPHPARGARSAEGVPMAGLVLYRHGERLSTVHSGDHAAARHGASRRAPPPPLAGDPAGDPGGPGGDGPRRGRRRRQPGASHGKASRCGASTSTSARSAGSGWS